MISATVGTWQQACRELADAGLRCVDWLTAIDRRDALEVVVCLVDPGTPRCELVSCQIDGDAPAIPSIASIFRGAEWHERETAEMFGIEFLGRVSTEPLLLRRSGQSPLRKSTPLEARVETPWPGEESESGRRRRKLPPGVRPEWVDDDG
jgi:NADH-quinone oxidoreductase subunit C